jgi:8-oxo-dGTP diphosphatase
LLKVGMRGPAESVSFRPVHRVEARHAASAGPRLNLHKDHNFVVEGDQIDFLPAVLRISPVPRNDGEALSARQEFGRQKLARFAFFRMTVHSSDSSKPLAYKIAVLVFLQNEAGEQLLMLRAKPPNLGVWSPIGGKLEMSTGESPFECAVRETEEEVGVTLDAADLHLFAIIAEKAYEGQTHWLLFLFQCKRALGGLPPDIAEGKFGFFSRQAIAGLPIPETDQTALWPIYDRYRDRFVMLKADCQPGQPLKVDIEEITPTLD